MVFDEGHETDILYQLQTTKSSDKDTQNDAEQGNFRISKNDVLYPNTFYKPVDTNTNQNELEESQSPSSLTERNLGSKDLSRKNKHVQTENNTARRYKNLSLCRRIWSSLS